MSQLLYLKQNLIKSQTFRDFANAAREVAITGELPTAQRDAQHVPRVLGILAHERSFATGSRPVRGRHAAVDPRHYARQAQGVRRWQGGGGVHRA